VSPATTWRYVDSGPRESLFWRMNPEPLRRQAHAADNGILFMAGPRT
jgi:hypothetical protein